jgi:hypothetical protein
MSNEKSRERLEKLQEELKVRQSGVALNETPAQTQKRVDALRELQRLTRKKKN